MTGPPLQFDPRTFESDFGRRPFRVSHGLAGHPLLQRSALRELVARHPVEHMEWNRGSVDAFARPEDVPANGVSAVETVDAIEECDSWVVVKRFEKDPEYGALLERCLEPVRPALESRGLGMFRFRGFLFVSSPRAVTPLHLDPEENFLLQIEGSKEMTLYDRGDRELLPAEELEAFAAGAHRNVSRTPGPESRPASFVIQPGEGVHVPLHAPHVVRNGDAVSVSFSVTFMTEEADRERSVLMLNHRLRRAGLKPTSAGASPFRDRVKHAMVRTVRSALGRGA